MPWPNDEPRRGSPPRDERRREGRYGEPVYGSYEDSVRDWEEQERLRQWDEYERARQDWERRVNEYRTADYRYGSHGGVKRPRSPSPYERGGRPRRDSHDYGRGGRGRNDDGRRSPPRRRHSPETRYRRSNLPHPMDQDRLIPYRSFIDWYKEYDPERYYEDEAASRGSENDRSVGLKARYDEFRADYNAKQVQVLFEKHRTAAWFLEKYDHTDSYADLRARVRKQGWQGALDSFLEDLESGKYDSVFDVPKPTVLEAKAEDGVNGDAIKVEEPETPIKEEAEKKDEDEDKTFEEADWMVGKDEDDVIIPHKGHQVMIKTIPPDIGRLKLEPVVDKLKGVVSLALGEPVARRNYYRSAWIEFSTEKEAQDAMDQLAGQEVEDFKLQVTMIRSPLIAKIKRTSVLVSAEKRLAEDLETMKKMVDMLEKETDMLANYKPLSERTKEEDKEGDIKMDSPVKENGENEASFVRRGTTLVQMYLDKKLPKGEDDETRLLRLSMSVDLYLQYLRSAFYCCYYCAVIADRADELQRKCVKHIRMPYNEKEYNDIMRNQKKSDREEHWFLLHDEKVEMLLDHDTIDPTRFGGKNYEKALEHKLRDKYRQEDDSKYRCTACSKMFKNAGFVCKHISNKHPELVPTEFTYEFKLYNNFALDPHRIQMPPANPPPPGTARHARDAGVGRRDGNLRKTTTDDAIPARKRTPPPDAKIDPRAAQAKRTYEDLDQVAGGEDIALMY